MAVTLPENVTNWLEGVFGSCNERASEKLTRIPASHEDWLDFSVIERLTQVSSPFMFPNDWRVHINTHFLGSAPMFDRWEIADIGIIVFFRRATRLLRTKIALLQSKRLYASEQRPETAEELDRRFMVGFGSLMTDDDTFKNMVTPRVFTFDESCQYKEIRKGQDQVDRIGKYERRSKIPVYYLLYNPWKLPISVDVPISSESQVAGRCDIGCRVVPSAAIRSIVRKLSDNDSPTYGDLLEHLRTPFRRQPNIAGWRLEDFIVHRLLACREGYSTNKKNILNDKTIYRVFSQRNAPISAAISITLDSPPDFEWEGFFG